jgi:hypothetical protein
MFDIFCKCLPAWATNYLNDSSVNDKPYRISSIVRELAMSLKRKNITNGTVQLREAAMKLNFCLFRSPHERLPS